MVDEVRQIEGKVLEISRLQEIFTEKVLEQVSEGLSAVEWVETRKVKRLYVCLCSHGRIQS